MIYDVAGILPSGGVQLDYPAPHCSKQACQPPGELLDTVFSMYLAKRISERIKLSALSRYIRDGSLVRKRFS